MESSRAGAAARLVRGPPRCKKPGPVFDALTAAGVAFRGMMRFWNGFKSGDWLTYPRLRGYSAIMLALSALGLLGWIALSDGVNDRNGKPLGTDFSSFYTAGQLAREGRAADAYDPASHHAQQRRQFGEATPYYAWAYPPVFFLIAAPLSALPFPLALALWQFGSFALYLAAIGLIVRGLRHRGIVIGRIWMLVAAAFPAVPINFGHGQNGFLTAAIFAAALAVLPAHPARAGALFALLAYKPQFALLIPFALLAARLWRAAFAGVIALAALLLVTTFIFGTDAWVAFAASGDVSRRVLLEQGAVGYDKLQSAFAAMRMWGGGVPLAYAVQGLVSLMALASVVWAWRRPGEYGVKAALLTLATLLASPHVLDYDLMLLAPAIAFLTGAGLAHGFRAFEIILLAAAWAVPLIARAVAGAALLPLGLSVTLALFAVALRREECAPAQL